VKAMAQMKNWNPAKLKGTVVPQRLVMPITFKLN
jgi:hypothetical protein